MTALTILSVGYPLAPVSPDAVGGAEQVLSMLDRGLTAAGHRSLVVAAAGSRVAGTLLPVQTGGGCLNEGTKAEAQRRFRDAIAAALRRHPVDIVHMHGIDFDAYLPPPGVPVLATLHGPADWYGHATRHPARPGTWLNGVSAAQTRTFGPLPALLAPIENGVPVGALYARHAKRGFALTLSRVSPEKGVHLALDAARVADVPLLVAGEVHAYPDHVRYFETEIRPRLDARRRFIGSLDFARKRRFLTAARAVLIPSLVAETSSLVAREALACGTPVIARPEGALVDAVDHGRTGFLADDAPAMAEALSRARDIDPAHCRAVARARFDEGAMVAGYLATYAAILSAARLTRARV